MKIKIEMQQGYHDNPKKMIEITGVFEAVAEAVTYLKENTKWYVVDFEKIDS